jgi:hypothetical protein
MRFQSKSMVLLWYGNCSNPIAFEVKSADSALDRRMFGAENDSSKGLKMLPLEGRPPPSKFPMEFNSNGIHSGGQRLAVRG